MTKTYIKEIFSSIQGEGLYIGEIQTFIRFCKCNLNCKYCDTDFKKDKNSTEYTPDELAQYILHTEIPTISLTGGEPLLETEFLSEFLPLIKSHKKIYLETNGTLPHELSKIIKFIDVISADIKLKSVTNQKNQFSLNDEFFDIAKEKDCFIKVVFDENIEKQEISEVIRIAKSHNLPIILQPKMIKNKFATNSDKLLEIFKIFHTIYPNSRLIPQMHKYLNIM